MFAAVAFNAIMQQELLPWLVAAIEVAKQQETCGRWLYKGILEANDEGVSEPAQYAYLPQHTFSLFWAAQHIWYPLDSNLWSTSAMFCQY